MPDSMNRQKIIERLKLKSDSELMRHDELEEILESELAKPAEEMDSQLITEIMDLLDEDKPDAEEQAACWSTIQKKRPRPRYRRILLHSAASVAAIIALFFVTLQTAEAFRWTFLLKLLRPVAETFGIYSSNSPDYAQTNNDNEAYTDDDTEFTQVVYQTLEEMPVEKDNVRLVPPWMPDSCSFVQGTVYEDPDVTTVTTVYERNDQYILLTITSFSDDVDNFAYEFEITSLEAGCEKISNQNVTYYRNNQGDLKAYSWIGTNAHYVISGEISEDELVMIIDGLTR